MRVSRSIVAVTAAIVALCAIPATSDAALGRVVTVGDSMASGMGLGPTFPVSATNPNPACGRTTGSYPQLAKARLSASAFVDVSCNGGHTGVFTSTNPGLNIPENNGVTIPPQFDALLGSEQAVIVGTGGNEAYFGEVAFACLGYQPDLNVYAAKLQGQNVDYWNNCLRTYGASGSGLLSKINNSESLVGPALDQIHQKSPNAKVFLVGIPRLATPDGAGCMPNPILTPADAPVYAVWEDQLRLAMKRVVAARSSWARFVDVQEISGTSHTMCAASWGQKWINPWSVEPGVTYPGIALHNTPAGANAMANAIIDSMRAAGLDTGSQAANATDPVVSISAPANNSLTKNATTTVSYTATDNVAVASCTPASGSTVNLNPGSNTITVDCQDHAGNHGIASVTVTRDSAPPSITISSPADNSNTTASSTTLNYTASDNLGTPNCTPASGSSISLSVGANTLTVNCTDTAGNAAAAAVTVNRGSVPVVAITSPENGLQTTSSTVNVTFTIGGGASIPVNTSCTINGNSTSSTSSNTVNLSAGANAITAVCTNQFGSSTPATVNVTGSPPSEVAITSPAEGANTTAASINVAYLVNGSTSIPGGTNCTVNGTASSNTSSNSVALSVGANTITVNCVGAFGSKSATVTVNRGSPPSVAITAPANGTSTAASSINVAYTVGGAASIPAGTGCTVAGVSSSSATSNSTPLSVGSNTLTVSCTNQFGAGTPASVNVTRGSVPVVAITAPANNTNTTASSINVAYTVGGSSSIPGGTTCSVGGSASSSATVNSVALATGSNAISVSCTNAFGTSAPAAVTVNRGAVPVVAISSPANNSNTASASTNVVYTVGGGNSIPEGTTCTVGGAGSSSTTTNAVALSTGSNTITVVCTNAFGSSSPASITVNRGAVPVVAMTAPSNNTNTTASSINLTFTVGGSSSIPGGTTCSVGGVASTTPSANSVPLAIGGNTIFVSCENAYGISAPVSVTVNRGNPPVVAVLAPLNGTVTSSTSVNVAFSVDGAGSIPSGTSCMVGGSGTNSATTNSVSLALGANTITVSCSSAFGSGGASVGVTRGNGPVVAITAPANGAQTTATQTNVAFTVNSAGTIPAGTTCTVGGQATTNTSTNSVPLALGSNVIGVKCSNSLGEDTKYVTVERGTPPSVSITSPADGLNTLGSSVSVSFSAGGTAAATCTVNGNQAESPLTIELSPGTNTVSVSCTSAFGSDTKAITVNRGTLPLVYIHADAYTETPAKFVSAKFSVDSLEGVPDGTSCTINGVPSTDPDHNPIELAVGLNTVTVVCTSAFGVGFASVYVDYTPPPTPVDPPVDPPDPAPNLGPKSISVRLGAPAKLKPAKSGGVFLKSGARGGLKLQIKLDAAADVDVRIERLGSGNSAKVKLAGRSTLALKPGTSTVRLSGRVDKRALAAGRYRVVVSVRGTKLRAVSKVFRVTR